MRVCQIVGAALICTAVLCCGTALYAQDSGSSIVGVVHDSSGGVLPGVTVEAASSALIEKVRAAVSDSDGLYRITDLRPGDYVVTFVLPGFSTLKREGITLPANFSATVNADMSVGALEETITVTGQVPLVDIANTRQQVQLERATLEALPGTGRVGGLSQIVPGATLGSPTRYSVGGVNDAAQFDYSMHGVPTAEPVVNGMTQMVGGMTLGVFVYNQATFQELVVETSGASADRETGGMQVNIIQRDGGNKFSGLASYSYSGPSLEADNISPAVQARHVTQVGGLKQYYDAAVAVGGPIKRDRIWFFGSTRAGVSQQYQQGNFYNKKQGTLFYEPDLSRPAATDQRTKDYTLRLTWQVTANHKFVVASSAQPNTNGLFNLLSPGATLAAPEASAHHDYNPQINTNLSWRNPATNRLLFEADLALLKVIVQTKPVPGTGLDPQVTDLGLNLRYGSRAQNLGVTGSYMYVDRTDNRSAFTMSYVTGRHNFKTGTMLRLFHTGNPDHNVNPNQINQAMSYTFRNGVPVNLSIWATPYAWVENGNDYSAYAQDQWKLGKATLNLGLRYNDTSTTLPETHLAAGPFVPARTLPEVKRQPHWRNLDPRVGLAYDVSGNARTAIKASIGRYNGILRSTATAPAAANITASTARAWNDANGNYVPECNLLDPVANGECGPWSDLTFGQNVVPSRNAPDASSGFNRQDNYWTSSVALQHELWPGIAVNVGYFRTWYGGFLATRNVLVNPATDYDEYCIAVPVDSRLPNSGDRLCGLYDLKPAKFGLRNNLVTQSSNFGKRRQTFNGVDVSLNARLARGLQVSGGVSTGQTLLDNCVVVNSPQDARPDFCRTAPPWSVGTQLKAMLVYPMPFSLQTSLIYQNFAGIPNNPTITVSNAQIAPSLGRNLSSCGTAASCSQTVTVDLVPTGQMYEPRVQQLDMRLTRSFSVSHYRLRGSVDIANLFNTSDVLQLQRAYGPSFLDAQQVMGGRLVKVGAQFDF